ncbi:MAG: hypothetical protein ACI92S_000253 [Planctomycetaceae bacterium]|jgi:hypothetical protein
MGLLTFDLQNICQKTFVIPTEQLSGVTNCVQMTVAFNRAAKPRAFLSETNSV